MPEGKLLESQKLDRLIGCRLGPYLSHNPVSATQIWQWCTAMGDNNPAYHAGEHQVAPAAMMQMWTMRDCDDKYAAGSTEAPPYQVFDDMASMGYPANVAVSYDIRFHHHLCVGDRVKHYTTIANISEKKTTKLGSGYFVTERVEYYTLNESLFADALITYFQYTPAVNTAEPTAPALASNTQQATAEEISADGHSDWHPDFTDVDVARLTPGFRLPALRIPITHKLIVAGAIATQDYIPVHHNLPAARAAGMPDIFMNILTTSGLSARYLSDWAGRGSCLKSLKFNLMAPNMPGDVMVMEGKVQDRILNVVDAQVIVAFTGKNSLGLHVSGTATMSLPKTDNKG